MNTSSWIMEADLPNPYIRVNQLHRGSFSMEPHTHPFWQFILVTDGQLQIKTGSDTGRPLQTKAGSDTTRRLQIKTGSGTSILHAGTLHILPPGWEHTLFSSGGYSQLGIDLRSDSSERDLIPLLEQTFSQPTNLSAEQLLTLAAQISEKQQKGTSLSAAQMVNLLDTLILFCLESADSAVSSFEEKLSSYLDANLHRPLRLQEIADHFYISVPQLERLCRRSYQGGVIALLKQRRFQKAGQLLISTELSIQEIGSVVGYPDPAHFSGFFRSCAGISPRAYRQQSRLYA